MSLLSRIRQSAQHLTGPRSLRFFAATFVGNCVIAASLISARPDIHWMATFWYSQAVGLTTCFLCLLVIPRLRDKRAGGLESLVWVSGTVLAGTLIGNAMGLLILKHGYGIEESRPGFLASIVISLAAGAIASVFFYNRERLHRMESDLEAQQWRSLAAHRMASQAELKALQAQIEPHFLFNTLANVSAAIDEDPAVARIMLNDLVAYLRTSLKHARSSSTTLGEEIQLNEKLLVIMRHRMGDRLRWRFDLEPGLETLPLAPMLIQPLIENAVKHGLEPQALGGEVRVSAKRNPGGVLIEVSDDGLGLQAAEASANNAYAGSGTGMQNITQRLQALYGSQASLHLREAAGRTIASLQIPDPHATTTASPA
jgi:sensor histidine kinase YesM